MKLSNEDKERLETIKERAEDMEAYNGDDELLIEDLDWMIEKIEELGKDE